MKRFAIWLLLGYLCQLLQVTILPLLIPHWLVPDLLLILVIALGLIEPLFPGVLTAVILGCLRDVFSVTTLGLYGFVVAALYLMVRLFSGQLNYDSPILFPSLVGAGTIAQGGLVLFCLLSLADADQYLGIVLADLPRTVLVNGFFGLLFAGPVMKVARGRRPYEA